MTDDDVRKAIEEHWNYYPYSAVDCNYEDMDTMDGDEFVHGTYAEFTNFASALAWLKRRGDNGTIDCRDITVYDSTREDDWGD